MTPARTGACVVAPDGEVFADRPVENGVMGGDQYTSAGILSLTTYLHNRDRRAHDAWSDFLTA